MEKQEKLQSEKRIEKNVRFIDGTFNAGDAKEILLAVLQDKVNFHGNLLLSNMERFGVDASNSEQRIAELRKEIESMRSLIADAEKEGAVVQIDSAIQIIVKK